MKKTVLITGSSGFCGSYIANYLEKKQLYKIFTTSRKKTNKTNHISYDLTSSISNNIFPKKLDCIIHCASNMDQKNEDYEIINTNLRIGYNLRQYAIQNEVKQIINFSSIAVYGNNTKTSLIDENSSESPSTSYGISKLLVEKLFSTLNQYRIQILNLRLGYILGPNLPQKYFILKLAERLQKNQNIELVNPDLTKFSFIYLNDIAKLCEISIKNNYYGVYNVINDQNPSIRKVFSEIKNFYPNSFSLIKEIIDKKTEFNIPASNKQIKQKFRINFSSYQEAFKNILKDYSK